jgi:hypothetical protein
MEKQFEVCGTCKISRRVIGTRVSPENDRILILECRHEVKQLKKVVNDNVGISERTNWTILRDPVAEIEKVVKEKDYFKIVAYSCAIFDFCGEQLLYWESKKLGKKAFSKTILENMNLEKIIDAIFECQIMTDTKMQEKMHIIRKLRNDFIHDEYSLKLKSEIANKVDDAIDDVINCIKVLKEKYDKMGTTPMS